MKRLAFLALVSASIAVPAASVLSSVAFAAPVPDEPAPGSPPVTGEREPAAKDGRGRRLRAGHRARHRAVHHRMAARRFLRALDLSDAQKATIRESREASAKVREDARAATREMVGAARKGGDRSDAARTALREKVRAVRASARLAVEPQAKRILESLTTEQRAKIEERAKARGKTVDEAKLLERIEGLLLGRGARRR
jgi:Spy/CpxP family protein refolding chaperone